MPPRPRKQLDSKRLAGSLRANILNLITNDLKAVACRATWRVCEEDVSLARLQIASKRLLLDDALSSVSAVQFFFSCVTSVCSNLKTSKDVGASGSESYPCVAYFVVYKECENFNESILFSTLHNQDMEPDIQAVKIRSKAATNSEMEAAARQLFQVVKDHDNPSMQEMLDMSNVYCYTNTEDSSSDAECGENMEFQPRHFPTVPCCLVVVNQHDFQAKLYEAGERLESDGFVVGYEDRGAVMNTPCVSSDSDITTTIMKIQKVMRLCNHALYRSHVYAKPDNAKVTFVKMMNVTTYLHKLLGNDTLRDKLIKHFQPIEKILSHPACEIIEQIQFDLDLIEVLDNCCFSIRSRSFIECPIPQSRFGKVSPRAFLPYNSDTAAQPGYFQEGVLNSFDDETVRINFLNKFYQCLIPSLMPHKVKKLVLVGPKDAGKTSWSNIFHRIIPSEYIASITSEKQFSAAMVTNETQLVIVDEWSTNTMQSDLAKTILQGGWMVTAVKHGAPRAIMNNSPYYITTNCLPDFGKENDNVKRRIAIFNTTSLPETLPGIDRWIYDHAMDCVAWVAEEITRNRHMIDKDELWYERTDTPLTIQPNEGEGLFNSKQIKEITDVDLCNDSSNSDSQSQQPVIHRSFTTEFRTRRLARKRRANRNSVQSDEESNGVEQNDIALNSDDEYYFLHNADQPETSTSRKTLRAEISSVNERKNETTAAGHLVDDDKSESNAPQPSTSHDVEPHAEKEAATLNENSAGQTFTTDNDTSAIDKGKQPQLPASTTEQDVERDLSSWHMRYYTPPSGWVLNDELYMKKVACLIKNDMLKDLTKRGYLYSFSERKRQAELKRDQKEKDFWTQPDPTIDAWMIIIGQRREVFDVTFFVEQQPGSVEELERVRKVLNLLVLPSRCPVARALADKGKDATDNTKNDDDEVPSQTYWTTIKKWKPW